MLFIAYAFKGQVPVFAGRVKIVSLSSCRTSAILKYFVPCLGFDLFAEKDKQIVPNLTSILDYFICTFCLIE